MAKTVQGIVLCVLTGILSGAMAYDGWQNYKLWRSWQEKGFHVNYLRNHVVLEFIAAAIMAVTLTAVTVLEFFSER